MTIQASPIRFSGFRPEDRRYFEPEPQKPRFWEPPGTKKPVPTGPIQVKMADKPLLKALETAAALDQTQDPRAMQLWAREWNLKARLMQLNTWATGELPYPHTKGWRMKLDQFKARRAAKKLFKNIAESKVYFPSGWILYHLDKLRGNYKLDYQRYFPSSQK